MGTIRREDISGRRFGKLVAESFAEIRNLKTYWNVLCDCGKRAVVRIDQMKSGNSLSCGCTRRTGGDGIELRAKQPPRDLAGRTFGRLTVAGPPQMRPGKSGRHWPCVCQCGKEVLLPAGSLGEGKGKTQSCGCLQREKAAALGKVQGPRNRRHGMTSTPTWNAWHGMRLRCNVPTQPAYVNYGGRGIAVCAGWESFESFSADMGERPTPKHSLGRIDNDGNYSCGHCEECLANGWVANCRWETWAQQQRNRRSNVNLTFNGETHCIADWVKITGIPRSCLYLRIMNGWTVEDALTRPSHHGKTRPGKVRRNRNHPAAT